MSSFEVKDQYLFFNNQEIKLPHDGVVSRSIEVGGLFIVLFRTKTKPEDHRNVLAFSEKGELLWQIEGQEFEQTTQYASSNAYSELEANLEGQLLVYHSKGLYYQVNLETGATTLQAGQRPW